jgi:alkylhydroperoxidase family enzyme
LCKFAEMVTHARGALSARHLETLRLHGLSDGDILDAVEVISYLNYIDRTADALGIDPEPEMQRAYEKWQTGSEEG